MTAFNELVVVLSCYNKMNFRFASLRHCHHLAVRLDGREDRDHGRRNRSLRGRQGLSLLNCFISICVLTNESHNKAFKEGKVWFYLLFLFAFKIK